MARQPRRRPPTSDPPWPTGVPVSTPAQPPGPVGEPPSDRRLEILGVTGLMRAGGYVYEEFLHELQGLQGRRVYREMRDNDPIVGGFLFATSMLIRKVGWEWHAADESPEAAEAATFVDQCWTDMSDSPQDTLSQILTHLTWGWSYLETVYKVRGGDSDDPTQRSKYDDGRIGWRKWAIRAQESLFHWEFDSEGGIRGMWQQPPPDFVLRFVPIEKALLFRTAIDKANPEGRSLLRSMYRPWYFKKHIEQIEGIGIERDLAGLPVIYAPSALFGSSLSTDQQTTMAALKAIVRNIRRDEQEGVLMPLEYDKNGHKLFELSLLSTGGQRQFDTDRTKQYYATQMLASALADFILLGHQQTGSYSLSQDKSELFSEAIGAWADGICHVINLHAVPRLLRMNGLDAKRAPELRHQQIERLDVGKLAAAIQALAAAGMPIFPNAQVERALYEALDLPVPAEVEESVDQPDLDDARDEQPEQPQADPGERTRSDADSNETGADQPGADEGLSAPEGVDKGQLPAGGKQVPRT